MDTRPSELSVGAFIGQLASDAPAPGGGSASALAGAMGAALVQMVVALTSGRPDAADVEDDLRELGLAAAGFQSELLQLVEIDGAAYASVVAARRLPRGTDRERELRRVQIDAALREATRALLTIADRADAVLNLAQRLAPIGSRNAISHVHKMLEEGTGADRQLKVFNETKSLVSVTDYIHSSFLSGL